MRLRSQKDKCQIFHLEHDYLYDTETAKVIDTYSNGLPYTDFDFFGEALYQKVAKEFFLLRNDRVIIPLSVDKAKKWVANHSTVEIYETLFGEVAE